jgi:hypothetical protein
MTTRPQDYSTLRRLEIGGGKIEQIGAVTRFSIPPTSSRAYADAMWDNYANLKRSQFPNKPTLHMTLRARFSHEADRLGGTAGFGFWNDPFTLSGGGLLAAPNCVWFFGGSPPNDQYLCEGVPGWGWKAATLKTHWSIAPLAAIGIALAQIPFLGKPIMTIGRRFIKAHEKLIDAKMTEWHEYSLVWEQNQATFAVDGITVLISPAPPQYPLGFVLWIDNQYAIASENGKFKFGMVEHQEERWMEIEVLSIEQ